MPQECEPDGCFLLRQREVDKLDIHIRGGRPRIGGMQPFIACPMQYERKVRLYPQARADRDRWRLTIELPHLNRTVFSMAPHIAIVCRFNQVEAFAVRGGAAQ